MKATTKVKRAAAAADGRAEAQVGYYCCRVNQQPRRLMVLKPCPQKTNANSADVQQTQANQTHLDVQVHQEEVVDIVHVAEQGV